MTLFGRATGVVAVLTLGACAVLGTPSRVRVGQLYATGSGRFDQYFGSVHAEQVSAGTWRQDRKAARKALLDVLQIVPDADDATIEQTTKDRLSSGTLRLDVHGTDVKVVEAAARHDTPQEVLVAVETTARAEIERARKLSELPGRLNALAKSGHELESHVGEDFAGTGQKPFEVEEELHASYEVLDAIGASAAQERRAAEQFIAELGRAVALGSEGGTPSPVVPPPVPRSKPARTAPPPPKPESAPKTAPPKPVARTEPAAHAAPKPKPAEAEVFNP